MHSVPGATIRLATTAQVTEAIEESNRLLGTGDPLGDHHHLDTDMHVVRILLALHNVEDRSKPPHHMCELLLGTTETGAEPYEVQMDLTQEAFEKMMPVPAEIMTLAVGFFGIGGESDGGR